MPKIIPKSSVQNHSRYLTFKDSPTLSFLFLISALIVCLLYCCPQSLTVYENCGAKTYLVTSNFKFKFPRRTPPEYSKTLQFQISNSISEKNTPISNSISEKNTTRMFCSNFKFNFRQEHHQNVPKRSNFKFIFRKGKTAAPYCQRLFNSIDRSCCTITESSLWFFFYNAFVSMCRLLSVIHAVAFEIIGKVSSEPS
jgi:hypothetical protein